MSSTADARNSHCRAQPHTAIRRQPALTERVSVLLPAHRLIPALTKGTSVITKNAALPAIAAFVFVSLGLNGCAAPASSSPESRGDVPVTITIAEPVHGIGYLPLYAAIESGAFEEEGITVEVTTLTGGGHVSSVLSGEVFGFIGGVESGAVANVKGASLKGVVNVVNRGNVYFVAPEGEEPKAGEDLGKYFEGKTIVGGRHGGTPNAILRHILIESGLDPDTDTILQELEDSAAIPSAMNAGAADIAVVAEPQLGLGIAQGLWGQPFLNVPAELGAYAYSSIVVPTKTIDENPGLIQRFVTALIKGQELIEGDPEYAFELAQREFATLDPAALKATLDRAYEDELWDGSCLSKTAIETNLKVARAGKILDDSSIKQSYETVATMTFTGDC
ncbi:ABC transporter substrate-binding protein [Salinibacterium hongtaonis]|uniref:ABC transporter substrate-binding protein n=1 Tax=Homoserinimonas hongtaonis TaxID=2079791 RepID=A0A2U1T1R2_9MICO|nr:ABC transporter substrate-binding protein [Salinibacterium hongtaonis]